MFPVTNFIKCEIESRCGNSFCYRAKCGKSVDSDFSKKCQCQVNICFFSYFFPPLIKVSCFAKWDNCFNAVSSGLMAKKTRMVFLFKVRALFTKFVHGINQTNYFGSNAFFTANKTKSFGCFCFYVNIFCWRYLNPLRYG